MRFTTAAASLLVAASTASALATPWLDNIAGFGSSSQTALADEPMPIPGDNPLFYCANPADYLMDLSYVDLSPNPPQAGKNLTISASGTLSKDVTEGTKVHISVKYGLIRILNQEVDLCEQAPKLDLECPIKKGKITLTREVELPNEIPPGKYTVLADVVDKDGETVTCLTASVVFRRGGEL